MTAVPTLKATEPLEITAEEFYNHPDYRGHELFDGRIVEKAMGAESDFVTMQFVTDLNIHLRKNPLARAFGPETGYDCFPKSQKPNMRKPDVSVVRKERLPGGKLPTGYFNIRPDFVFESISSNDKADDVEWRIQQFLRVGVPLLFIVTARVRVGRVIRGDGSGLIIGENGVFDGGDVLPGFTVRLGDILPTLEEQHSLMLREDGEEGGDAPA